MALSVLSAYSKKAKSILFQLLTDSYSVFKKPRKKVKKYGRVQKTAFSLLKTNQLNDIEIDNSCLRHSFTKDSD